MIKELTKSQIDRFPLYVDKWLKIGLSTGDCDFEKAKEAATRVYEVAGLNPPQHFYVFDSPYSAAIGAKFMKAIYQNLNVTDFGKMGAQGRAQVSAQVSAQVGDQVRAQVSAQVFGCHDANWLAFYDFFLNECDLSCCDKLMPLMDLARHTGWWAPYENVCVFQHKPDHVKFDENKVLHCENGPAIKYRDGFSVYAWHGVRVPAGWIENKDNLNPADVLKCENVEQRAAGASIIGWPKMLKVLDAKVINDSGNPDIGQLIEVTLPGLSEPGRFLKAECPRNGIICEGVPYTSDIDGLPIDTAIAAQAWRIGDPQSDYIHPENRT